MTVGRFIEHVIPGLSSKPSVPLWWPTPEPNKLEWMTENPGTQLTGKVAVLLGLSLQEVLTQFTGIGSSKLILRHKVSEDLAVFFVFENEQFRSTT